MAPALARRRTPVEFVATDCDPPAVFQLAGSWTFVAGIDERSALDLSRPGGPAELDCRLADGTRAQPVPLSDVDVADLVP